MLACVVCMSILLSTESYRGCVHLVGQSFVISLPSTRCRQLMSSSDALSWRFDSTCTFTRRCLPSTTLRSGACPSARTFAGDTLTCSPPIVRRQVQVGRAVQLRQQSCYQRRRRAHGAPAKRPVQLRPGQTRLQLPPAHHDPAQCREHPRWLLARRSCAKLFGRALCDDRPIHES